MKANETISLFLKKSSQSFWNVHLDYVIVVKELSAVKRKGRQFAVLFLRGLLEAESEHERYCEDLSPYLEEGAGVSHPD